MKIKVMCTEITRRAEAVIGFFKAAILEWIEDRAMRQAAALAFYSIFSLAPLLVIAVAVAGFVFGEQAVEGEVVAQIEEFIGYDGAVLVEDMLRHVRVSESSWLATTISLVTMFFGALVIFSALQDALNTIWGVEPKPEAGILYVIKRRVLAFAMILVLGFLLMAAILASTILSVVQTVANDWFPEELAVFHSGDSIVIFAFIAGIFTLIYKFLPDVRMLWRDVFFGGLMTALLFMFGEYGINSYLKFSSAGSVFGAAGTLAVLLLWIYYSWIVVLMGAEMTQVWARRYGGGIEPGENAILIVSRRRKIAAGRIKIVRENPEGELEAVGLDQVDLDEDEESLPKKERE